MNLLSVIIPCYNEALVVRETYNRLNAIFTPQPYQVEFIFLNNRSEDSTLEILKGMALEDQRVKVINMSRNFGHQGSVTCGINNCSGDVAAIDAAGRWHVECGLLAETPLAGREHDCAAAGGCLIAGLQAAC